MRNNRRAGKPAGRKPEKQGLTGLFTKGKNIPTTAQQTLPYREMYRDGVCRVADRYYTKTIEYEDINYQLAQSEDQAAIFDGWSACLNYFDSSLPFQLSFLNHRSRPGSRYSVNIPMQDDDYNSVRCEYVEMLENQIAKSNNGIVRTKLLTFGVNVDDLPTARARLERVEADICGNFKKLGVKCRSLSGLERLELLHGQLHPGSGSPFRFSWDMIPKTGLSTKDFIAPDSFDFRFSRLFRVGTTWGAASYLQILASELSDKLLAELLEMDAEMTITLHIQTVDQAAAVKSIKAKVSDIDKMKVEEQKKAARAGYDMDILPPDLVTYSNDAKILLEDLQSRNERMFLLTFLVVNMAPTRRELDNDLFTVSGIVQSSRFKVQLYFWTIPDTVNRSLSSSRRVGAMFTTRKVSRNILSFRLCKSSRRVFASLLYVTRSGGSMSMSYPDRAAFFCSSTFILSMSETLALIDFTAAA